jgi:ParB-like chromosome segregation protein Spo0J
MAKARTSKKKATEQAPGIAVRTKPEDHLISHVEWVDPATLVANDYNPNKVFLPELELLKQSLLEDGWSNACILVREPNIVVDGFHRWTLGLRDDQVRAMSGGLVPIVRSKMERSQAQLATIRHNRARGQHGILKMGEIVRELRESGLTDDAIQQRLGMEQEEIDRLTDLRSSPELAGKESFGKGWVPTPKG